MSSRDWTLIGWIVLALIAAGLVLIAAAITDAAWLGIVAVGLIFFVLVQRDRVLIGSRGWALLLGTVAVAVLVGLVVELSGI